MKRVILKTSSVVCLFFLEHMAYCAYLQDEIPQTNNDTTKFTLELLQEQSREISFSDMQVIPLLKACVDDCCSQEKEIPLNISVGDWNLFSPLINDLKKIYAETTARLGSIKPENIIEKEILKKKDTESFKFIKFENDYIEYPSARDIEPEYLKTFLKDSYKAYLIANMYYTKINSLHVETIIRLQQIADYTGIDLLNNLCLLRLMTLLKDKKNLELFLKKIKDDSNYLTPNAQTDMKNLYLERHLELNYLSPQNGYASLAGTDYFRRIFIAENNRILKINHTPLNEVLDANFLAARRIEKPSYPLLDEKETKIPYELQELIVLRCLKHEWKKNYIDHAIQNNFYARKGGPLPVSISHKDYPLLSEKIKSIMKNDGISKEKLRGLISKQDYAKKIISSWSASFFDTYLISGLIVIFSMGTTVSFLKVCRPDIFSAVPDESLLFSRCLNGSQAIVGLVGLYAIFEYSHVIKKNK